MVDKKRPLTVVPVRIGIQSGVAEGKSRYFPEILAINIFGGENRNCRICTGKADDF